MVCCGGVVDGEAGGWWRVGGVKCIVAVVRGVMGGGVVLR